MGSAAQQCLEHAAKACKQFFSSPSDAASVSIPPNVNALNVTFDVIFLVLEYIGHKSVNLSLMLPNKTWCKECWKFCMLHPKFVGRALKQACRTDNLDLFQALLQEFSDGWMPKWIAKSQGLDKSVDMLAIALRLNSVNISKVIASQVMTKGDISKFLESHFSELVSKYPEALRVLLDTPVLATQKLPDAFLGNAPAVARLISHIVLYDATDIIDTIVSLGVEITDEHIVCAAIPASSKATKKAVAFPAATILKILDYAPYRGHYVDYFCFFASNVEYSSRLAHLLRSYTAELNNEASSLGDLGDRHDLVRAVRNVVYEFDLQLKTQVVTMPWVRYKYWWSCLRRNATGTDITREALLPLCTQPPSYQELLVLLYIPIAEEHCMRFIRQIHRELTDDQLWCVVDVYCSHYFSPSTSFLKFIFGLKRIRPSDALVKSENFLRWGAEVLDEMLQDVNFSFDATVLAIMIVLAHSKSVPRIQVLQTLLADARATLDSVSTQVTQLVRKLKRCLCYDQSLALVTSTVFSHEKCDLTYKDSTSLCPLGLEMFLSAADASFYVERCRIRVCFARRNLETRPKEIH